MVTAAPVWAPRAAAAEEWRALQVGLRAAHGRVPCQLAPSRWWSTVPGATEAAADACFDCPIMGLCASYALTAREPDGVWGGLTPAARTLAGELVAS